MGNIAKKTVLFVATVDSHILYFHIPYIKWFRDQGYAVHVATNGDADIPYAEKRYCIPVQRSPFHLSNLRAIRDLRQILRENAYELIHCHTPMGSVVTRLAAGMARRKGARVLYTAHGFHFYNGAPLLNWLIYFPVEWLLSFRTDCLITINDEDYIRAKRRLHAKETVFVHGVGLDTSRVNIDYTNAEKEALRKSLNIPQGARMLFFAGELIDRKNQMFLLKLMAELKEAPQSYVLALAGTGKNETMNSDFAKTYGIENCVRFLGWRQDIGALLAAADVYVSASKSEGLPVNILEAMYAGKPIVASDIRGHRDLLRGAESAALISLEAKDAPACFAQAIQRLGEQTETVYGCEPFLLKNVMGKMQPLYKQALRKTE